MNKFDRIIKENFRGPAMSLLRRVLNIEKAEIIALPGKIHRTLEREMDMLLQVISPEGEKTILNIEWQTTNDPYMCNRMLLYHSMIQIVYKIPVSGVVIYIGEDRMNMPGKIEQDNLNYSYTQIDLKELNPEDFLQSDNPEEVLLAVLAGKTRSEEKREIIRKILFKLRSTLQADGQELNRRIAQLEILGELRGVQQIILKEEQIMAFTYNLKKDIRYNQGLEAGIEKGIEKGIKKGIEKGVEKATIERNTSIVLNLLQHTDFQAEKIAKLVNVPLDFVSALKERQNM